MSRQSLDEVVSFRIDRPTVDRLDKIAQRAMRSRGNQIMVLLKQALAAIESTTADLEHLVKNLTDEEQRNPNSPQAEYLRGRLHSTKLMLSRFWGEATKEQVLDEVRRRTNLPIPHIVPLSPDGNRYGIDMDAG